MRKKISKQKIGSAKEFAGARIAIVASSYHRELINSMERACRQTLIKAGVANANIKTLWAPGSWEIPVIAKKIAASKKYDGIATLGVIVKGDTYHFEMIANECGRALMEIAVSHIIPISLEVLAVYKKAQAQARATGEFNKGREAAQAVLQSIKVLKGI